MPDTRSALASCAARRASSGTASTAPAIWNASSAMRSTRSFCVPSFSWNVMPSSALAISSSGCFRSCSQKNLASESRARDHLLVAGDDLLAAVLGASGSTPAGSGWRACPSADRAARSTSGAASSTSSGIRPAPPGTPRRTAHQHERPFREPGVLGQQRLVLDQLQLVLLGQRPRLLGDQAAALGRRRACTLCAFRPLA